MPNIMTLVQMFLQLFTKFHLVTKQKVTKGQNPHSYVWITLKSKLGHLLIITKLYATDHDPNSSCSPDIFLTRLHYYTKYLGPKKGKSERGITCTITNRICSKNNQVIYASLLICVLNIMTLA